MIKKSLIFYIPVIHKGYLDFLIKNRKRISAVYLVDEKFLKELSSTKPDIAAIETKTIKNLLNKMGFKKIMILSMEKIKNLQGKEIILIQDEVSRNLSKKYFKEEKIEWQSVFLRWDRDKVLSELPFKNIARSNKIFDIKMMKKAYQESEKSSDWWRRVGVVLVKNKKIIAKAYNQGLPSDHTPYQLGSVRDFFKAGEKQEFSSTIHAEQKLIAWAAKKGISLQGTSIYLTHFPCPVCAKIIVCSGIKKVYFSEGASVLTGQEILETAGIDLIYLPIG